MPFTGDTFTKLFSWLTDQQRNKKIFDARLDAEFGGIATGLSDVAARVTTVEGDVSDLEGVAVTADSAFGTDNLLLRSDGTARKAQASPVVVADTTGALSRNGGGGIPLQGTNTNDDAAAGQVGEIIESNVPGASPVSLSTGTAANVTSISLTAGDWDVWGTLGYNTNASTNWTVIATFISLSSATVDFTNSRWWSLAKAASVDGAATFGGYAAGPARLSLSGTTTVYLVSRCTFSAGTLETFGRLRARRIR